MQTLDADAMRRFCDDVLPELLADACGVDRDRAKSVAADTMARAESFCALSYQQQEVLAAPFFEDSFDHDPEDASLWQKAVTTVVVRNSELEDLHVEGIVDSGGITAITTFALGPLSHLRAARKASSTGTVPDEVGFASLEQRYPRAWACLEQLRDVLDQGGGRVGYRCPDAPVPTMPAAEEIIEAPTSSTAVIPSARQPAVVLSAIDPRFDQNLADLIPPTVRCRHEESDRPHTLDRPFAQDRIGNGFQRHRPRSSPAGSFDLTRRGTSSRHPPGAACRH